VFRKPQEIRKACNNCRVVAKKIPEDKKEDTCVSKLERIFTVTFMEFLFMLRQKMLPNLARV